MGSVRDVLCLSHLRWNFVFQRPNHLMSRCAAERRVFFFEEPVLDADRPHLEVVNEGARLFRCVPHLPPGTTDTIEPQRALLHRLLAEAQVDPASACRWYYTPAALPFTSHLQPLVSVYDNMDELSAFAGASPELRGLEAELLEQVDLVFTGGMSLYEHKRQLHPRVTAFPSGVDTAHYARAKEPLLDPADQSPIPRPRIGYFGVIDERLDPVLLQQIAALQPNWQFVMVGPVVKIDPATLPRRPNIHYLGPKPYPELPGYIAGWDAAFMPFALNRATRFISPTKTLEYLAAGKSVVSTPIRDVVHPYQKLGLVGVAERAEDFVAELEVALVPPPPTWHDRVAQVLERSSWDHIFQRMFQQVEEVAGAKTKDAVQPCSTTW